MMAKRSVADTSESVCDLAAFSADRDDMRATQKRLCYVLITAARNEAAFIEQTICSVIAQSMRPRKWVIVSDGSTDGTDEIVQRYAGKHDWIELLRMPERPDRQFAGKAHAFNAAYSSLVTRHSSLPFDVIGNLDADITFDPDYFSFLLSKFQLSQKLGVAGTPFREGEETYDFRFSSTDHVSGACQLFRRECFEQIGGYVPVAGGGLDVIAVLTARMKGWHTQTFTEKVCEHHRPMNSANFKHKFVASFKLGRRAYHVGFHPVWQVFRSIYQMSRRPYVMGGCALFLGYFWAMLCREPRPVSQELVDFQRRDQLKRLRVFFKRLLKYRSGSHKQAEGRVARSE
jgi:poly-beta-1,6-N-acetyl-D-glucosamine synthase